MWMWKEKEGSEIPYSLTREFQLSKWLSHMEKLKQMDTYALRSHTFI